MALTFDGPGKLVILSSGTTTLSVRDLWSRWVDWTEIGDNSKYLPAMTQVGGQAIDPLAGTSIPIYVFLANGWRLRPQEASHTLNVGDGVLLVDGGGDPFVNTTGSFVVRVNYQQPVQAISFSSSGAPAVDPWASSIEGAFTAGDVQRLLLAYVSGLTLVSKGPPPVFTFLSQDGLKQRIRAVMNSGGGRAAITLDPS